MRTASDEQPLRSRNLYVSVAIGDWVVPSDDGERIDHILERTSAFVRRASFEGDRFEADALAANIDVVFLVHALGSPPNQRRLERELVLAFDSGAEPVVLMTKVDTVDDPEPARAELVEVALGVPVLLASGLASVGLEPIREYAAGNRTLAFLGASGVGKSTLVNALLDDQVMHTAAVREGDQRGRHTTVTAQLLRLRGAASVIKGMPRVRTYAPVGAHEDLLPYLVRRLLENGANSSFVNRFMDADVPVADVVSDPVSEVAAMSDKRHSGIPVPADLYGDRRNSAGLDLTDPLETRELIDALAERSTTTYTAPSIVCGKEVGGEEILVTSPADKHVIIGTTRHAEDADIDRALDAAVSAQKGWDAVGGEGRAQILERLADLIEEHRVPLLDLLAREAGRVIADGISEVREAADFCRYYALQARLNFAEPRALKSPTGESNELSMHGRGVFFCISPWNFPLAIFTGQVTAGLAAGNAVIAKPADPTPLVGAYAVRLMHEAGVPTDVLHLLYGRGSKMGATVVSDERIIGVALTGSTTTAQTINRSLAAKNGTINTLIAETGGQNVMIVDSSALPEQVTDDVLTSAFSSAGQRCSALRVLYLQESIADKVINMLKGALAERQIGDPLDLATDIGPVINLSTRNGLEKHIDRMHKEGKLIARGKVPDNLENGSYLAPHIFEIPALSTLTDEEFGPILHVIRYKHGDIDKVMSDIADTGFGLTFGVHSRIEGYWLDLFAKHSVGNTYVNRNMIGAVVGVQPFGGMGLSGTGPKAGGPHYLLRFANEKILTINTAAIGGNTELFRLNE